MPIPGIGIVSRKFHERPSVNFPMGRKRSVPPPPPAVLRKICFLRVSLYRPTPPRPFVVLRSLLTRAKLSSRKKLEKSKAKSKTTSCLSSCRTQFRRYYISLIEHVCVSRLDLTLRTLLYFACFSVLLFLLSIFLDILDRGTQLFSPKIIFH